jgi:tripartite-type tricarboxylate transporter receptor subunit TctC
MSGRSIESSCPGLSRASTSFSLLAAKTWMAGTSPAMTLALRALPLALLLASGPALAQTSQKPMQIIVPFAPGASADGIARTIASELAPRLGRQVIVENKPGAGGSLGLMTLAKAPADGDTLSVGATGALVINPHLPGAAAFDPLRELIPIAKLIDVPLVIVANPRTGPKSITDMIARSKSSPEGVSYGTTGTNSGMHLTMELLKKTTGGNFVHVPYRGSAPAVTDAVGGQIPLAVVDLTSAHPHIKAGTLIALGVPHAKRTAMAPEIPTVAEAGVPGFGRIGGFIGLFAPAGTPAPIVKRISREVGAILAVPEVKDRVRLLSVEPAYEDDATFARMLAEESAKWKELLQSMPAAN